MEIFLKNIADRVKTQNSNISFHDILEHYEAHIVAEFYGGLNGCGSWIDYLEDLKTLLSEINKKHECWIVDLENDCLDDVFYVRIGVRV